MYSNFWPYNNTIFQMFLLLNCGTRETKEIYVPTNSYVKMPTNNGREFSKHWMREPSRQIAKTVYRNYLKTNKFKYTIFYILL